MSSFYAAAAAIIENEDGEILMVQEGKEHIHGKWNFPGGGWEDAESVIKCVEREVLEETGYEIEINGFLGIYKELNQEDGTETIVFIFTADPEERTDKAEEDDEIIDVGFKELSKIEELELRHENRKKIIKKYRTQEPESLEMLWNDLNLLAPE